jgi:hypothetical protein
VRSIEKNGWLVKVFMGVLLALMCTLFLKFERLDVALGFLVEKGKLYLTSTFATVAMVEKITYKKKSESAVQQTVNYLLGWKPRCVLFISYIKD